MTINRMAKDTLTPIELDWNDVFNFTLNNGNICKIKLLKTGGQIIKTDLENIDISRNGAKTVYSFFCELEINGKVHRLERENPTQKSFYEPWKIGGVNIWFDGVSDIFKADNGFFEEKDANGGIFCKPNKKARFAFQDESLEICPELLHPWCPLPEGGLKIENCYRGEDCWMGPYNGNLTHGGLDINHAPGTPLWAPFDLDDQFYFNSLEMGQNNNRWRAVRRWKNGSEWIIQAHHMTALTVPEHIPLKRGQQFAKGAGVLSGAADHSHFVFRIREDGIEYFLDPWILFWKMYKDNK